MRIETEDGSTVNTHDADGRRCRAELPWTTRACVNDADGPDGACGECRAELADIERWADERESREDYERSYGPHAARARFGGAR